MKGVRKVHASYVETPTEEWVVADGGRCYKEEEVRLGFVTMVKCPLCTVKARWFPSEGAYQQHWGTIHQVP